MNLLTMKFHAKLQQYLKAKQKLRLEWIKFKIWSRSRKSKIKEFIYQNIKFDIIYANLIIFWHSS